MSPVFGPAGWPSRWTLARISSSLINLLKHSVAVGLVACHRRFAVVVSTWLAGLSTWRAAGRAGASMSEQVLYRPSESATWRSTTRCTEMSSGNLATCPRVFFRPFAMLYLENDSLQDAIINHRR